MIRVGGMPHGLGEAGDVEFCGLLYPEGEEITKRMALRLREGPFYQSDKLLAALAFVKRRGGAIDCGAWVGGWSRELARSFDHVVAIEANPESFRCLLKNLSPYQNVRPLNVAVGDQRGRVIIERDSLGGPQDSLGPNVGSRVSRGRPAERASHVGEVALCRLDDLPEVKALPTVDYLKVHVNGMELRALRGAEMTIRTHRPIITVVLKLAIENFGDTTEAARAFLRGLRYRHLGGKNKYEIWGPA